MIALRWLTNILILLLVANIMPGVYFSSFWSVLITSIVFGLINAVVRPLMIILTLPINLITFGLFTLLINALMMWLASTIVKGFEINNFYSAFGAALLYWLFVTIINYIEKPRIKVKI